MNPFQLFAYQRSMIADERRLDAYRRALSVAIKPGDIVVDVGAGLGALSIMAAQAGAARIYAIDRSVPDHLIRATLEQNGVADRVTTFHAESRNVTLPERGHVVIAEIGLDEESLLDAAQRFLRPGGRILPRVVSVCMAPVHAPELYSELVEFWEERHAGIAFLPVRRMAANVIHRTSLQGINLLASPETLLKAETEVLQAGMLTGTAEFSLTSDCVVHGLAAWHRAELVEGLWHDNPPPGPPESWAHNFIPLSVPVQAVAGTRLRLSVTKRGQIWMWRGTCGSQTFDQSTFVNLHLDVPNRRTEWHG